jgi:predicted  nucleic acid-binding Zn-ribbon protein
MPAKDLGVKYTCFKCGTRFYDLKKLDPLCPKCGADQREITAQKAPSAEKRSRPPARPAIEPEKELDAEPALEEELEESDDDQEDAQAADEE